MEQTIFSFAVVLAIILVAQSKPWDPSPRTEQWWIDRHNSFVENSRNNSADIKIVFTGSSSIEHWGSTGLEIWNAKYKPLGAVNYGIGGDRIEHCLWRIVNGELENLNPKILVLYCGSNNIPSDSALETAQGIMVTLNELARRLPQTKILYMTVNPRGDMSPIEAAWNKIISVNEQTMDLDNDENRTVFDMFDELIVSWGQLKTELYQGDLLHLNRAGYEHWDASWNETFFNLWNGGN